MLQIQGDLFLIGTGKAGIHEMVSLTESIIDFLVNHRIELPDPIVHLRKRKCRLTLRKPTDWEEIFPNHIPDKD